MARFIWAFALLVGCAALTAPTQAQENDCVFEKTGKIILRGFWSEGRKIPPDALKAILKKHLEWLEEVGPFPNDSQLKDERRANLSNAALDFTILDQAKAELTKDCLVNLSSAELQDASMEFTDLRGARLWGAKLNGTSFSNAIMDDVLSK